MQQGGLDGCSLAACGLNKCGLKGAEGDFINKPLAATGSAWFPRHEGAICNHAADGHGRVMKHACGMLDGNAAGCGQGLA